MRLLLDTHVLLWTTDASSGRLSKSARRAIQNPDHEVFVSVVSAWEIAIKQSLGKLEIPDVAERWVPKVLAHSGFEWAPFGPADALRVRTLPWHHRDPFDRLLVANAIEQSFTLVTHDAQLAAYGVGVLSA